MCGGWHRREILWHSVAELTKLPLVIAQAGEQLRYATLNNKQGRADGTQYADGHNSSSSSSL